MHLISKSLASLIASTFFSLFFYKTQQIYKMRKRYEHIPGPPTPPGILGFYLGNLQKIVFTMANGKLLADQMIEWVKLYGNIFKFQVFDQVIVFTISTDGIKQVLISKNFPKPFGIYGNVAYPYNERFLGDGLISVTESTKWRIRRAKLNPGFHKAILKSFIGDVNSKINILLNRFVNLADGKTCVKMLKEMNNATLDLIASIAFSMDVDSINDPENTLNRYVYECLEGFYRIQFEPFIFLNPLEWGYIWRYKSTVRKLRDIGRQVILKRIQSLQNGDYVPEDLLSHLLKTHELEEFDIEDLVDDFATFFVAGQETTANTLAFCFIEIARNPDVLKKLRVEIDEVLGLRKDITHDDLPKLNYTSCVYKETLRLWPAIPEIARGVDADLNIEGYQIPQNTWVQVSTYVNARQEKYFPEPEDFRPERFMVEEKSGQYTHLIDNYTYFPFSLGPRGCIGQNLAHMVGKMFIAKIVRNFDISLDMTQDFGVTQVATLRPRDYARVFLTPRQF